MNIGVKKSNQGPFQVQGGMHRGEMEGNRSRDQIFDLSVPTTDPPLRNQDCPNYSTCLDLAAALNWESFTCAGCDGTVNSSLYWLAGHNRRDPVVEALCDLPPIATLDGAVAPSQAETTNGDKSER